LLAKIIYSDVRNEVEKFPMALHHTYKEIS